MDASGQNYKDTFRYTDVEYTPDGHTDVYRWDVCKKSQFRYGYRRVADTLRKATGVRIADKTVLKVMREEGLLCRTRRRRKYRSYMGQVGKSSPNLLARDFEAEDPMTKLVTDVTEFKVGGTKLYLSPVVDLYNDEVVAYSISRSPNMKMVLEMLAGLEGRLDGEDAPLLHSDMGWQYQMPAYRLALERMGIAQSMSRKGNCLDNAKAENFFSMVKTELYYDWGETTPISSRGIWRSTSTGTTTCASRGAWTEAARSSTGSAGPLDSLLLPFRKRGPLHKMDLVDFYILLDNLYDSPDVGPCSLPRFSERAYGTARESYRFGETAFDIYQVADSPDRPYLVKISTGEGACKDAGLRFASVGEAKAWCHRYSLRELAEDDKKPEPAVFAAAAKTAAGCSGGDGAGDAGAIKL